MYREDNYIDQDQNDFRQDEIEFDFNVEECLKTQINVVEFESNVFDLDINNHALLSFNGNADLAKQYSYQLAHNLQLQNSTEEYLNSNFDNNRILSGIIDIPSSNLISISIDQNPIILTPHNPDPNRFLVSAKESRKIYILQFPKETRPKFLLRFPVLLQECMNTGNLVKLKFLLKDVLDENCIFNRMTSPPFMGVDKIYQSMCALLRNSPDYCTIFYKIKQEGKRMISFRSNTFGTLPFLDTNSDQIGKYDYGNFMELSSSSSSPTVVLNEYHKAQKLKYDELRNQGKTIRFERRSIWFLMCDRQCNKICKVTCKAASVDIFEGCKY